jgi:hypothetical protein
MGGVDLMRAASGIRRYELSLIHGQRSPSTSPPLPALQPVDPLRDAAMTAATLSTRQTASRLKAQPWPSCANTPLIASA